jgi:trans-aconitate 2-methyltransferase
VQEPGFYYDTLASHCAQLAIWETQYIHVMPDAAAIVEWYKGTGLRPYLDRLSPDRQKAFLDELLTRVTHRYPAQADGNVLFPFQRIFVLATR